MLKWSSAFANIAAGGGGGGAKLLTEVPLSGQPTVIKIRIEFLMNIMILTVKFRQVLTQFIII